MEHHGTPINQHQPTIRFWEPLDVLLSLRAVVLVEDQAPAVFSFGQSAMGNASPFITSSLALKRLTIWGWVNIDHQKWGNNG